MASGLVSVTGADFDDLFQASGGDQLLNIYANDGQDIGQKYMNVNAGQMIPDNTNFFVPDGQDVRYKLCAKGTGQVGLFRPSNEPWNVGYGGNNNLSFWTNYVNAWIADKQNGTMTKVNNVENDCIYRGVNSDYGYSQVLFAYSPGGNVTFSIEKIDQHIWHNSWCNTYWEDLIIDNTVRGVRIWCSAGAGGGVQTVVRVNATAGGEAIVYEAVYGIDNDSNRPTIGTAQNVTFNGKLYTFYRG